LQEVNLKKESKMTKPNSTSMRVKREVDKTPRRYCILTLVFGFIIVAGFLFAARQHFGAINLGMENSELRKKRDDLSTKQRQLRIAREVAFSPVELEKAAMKIGLERVSFSNKFNTEVQPAKDVHSLRTETGKIEEKKDRDSNPFDNVTKTEKRKSELKDQAIEVTKKDGSKKIIEAEKSRKDSKSDKRIETSTKDFIEKDGRISKL
jgi:hypothetical protein